MRTYTTVYANFFQNNVLFGCSITIEQGTKLGKNQGGYKTSAQIKEKGKRKLRIKNKEESTRPKSKTFYIVPVVKLSWLYL